MDFFDDLEFVCSGKCSNCSSAYTRHFFDGYYGLQFISKGKVQLQVGNSAVLSAQTPVCFFTSPGEAFSYNCPPGETREHYFVCFKGERAERYRAGGLLPEKPEARFYPVKASDKFLSNWKNLLRYLRQGGRFSHGEAVLRLEKLLFEVAKSAQQGNDDPAADERLTDLIAQIADNPGREWNIAAEAARLELSEVHFRRLFKQTTGMPLWHYVLGCRIRYASQLLLSTDKLVKEIACECGFNGVFHFSREFKKVMKKSPENFRKSI